MTNPGAAMRMLITYAICIPLAVAVGYLLANQMDYGSLGFLGLVAALILAPVFIKWHYPIMVFGLGFPAMFFFLKGNPPCWQIVVLLSLGLAIVERAMSSEKRFLKASSMTWALLFTAGMAVVTMQLTGGFALQQLGGDAGGGKKYITLFLGIATFFALISRGIPPERRNLYIGLFFISPAFGFIGDLFPFLPSPFNYINLMFPPTGDVGGNDISSIGTVLKRFGGLSVSATAIMFFLLARYGLRGILSGAHPFRTLLFALSLILSLVGGFRSILIGNIILLITLFFIEGLHRTRWMVVMMVFTLMFGCLVVPFSRQLPMTFQRAMSFLPLDVDPEARANAEASTEWRLRIWRAVWPQVPSYLLLGKGYRLTSLDFESMGVNSAFGGAAAVDASQEGLAISNDFHSGPLSTLICFGLWGAVGMLAIMLAGLRIVYRNFKYGDPELRNVNAMLLASHVHHVLYYFFIFGAFESDVAGFAQTVGFSVALNWGVCGPKSEPAVMQRIKPLAEPQPA
jgi:hypothetical protein